MDKSLAKANAEIQALRYQLAEIRRKNETKFSALERDLHEVQEFARVGWWSVDLQANSIHWSGEIYKQYGWDENEKAPSLEEFLCMVHPEDKEKVKEHLYRAKQQGHDTFEIRIITPEQVLRYIKGSVRPVCNAAGKVTGLYGTSLDVTEIREAEEALRLEKEKYQLITENMRDLICMHTTDGTMRYLSPSVERILGYTAEELIGKNPYTLLHPEDVDLIRTGPHKSALEGLTEDSVEYRLRRKDGQYIWMQANFTPVIVDGNIVAIQSVSRDITEQKLAQEKLEVSERNYRRLAANIPGTDVYLFDQHKRLILAEGSIMKHLGINSQDFEGKSLHEAVGENLAAQLNPLYDDILNGKSVSTDILYQGRHFSMNGVPLRNEKGESEGGLMVAVDVSGRKQAEDNIIKIKEELEDAQELARIGSWELDVASGKISVSAQFKSLLHLPLEYAPNLKEGLSLFTKSSKRDFQEAIHRATKEGKNFDVQLQVYTGTHERIWVRVLGRTVTRNRKAFKIKCVFQDITREKNTDLNIRHFQQGLKMLSMIASRGNLDFKEQIQRALQEVATYLNMSLGIISRVEGEFCCIEHTVRTETGLPDLSQQSLPLEKTYCGLPYIQQKVVDIPHVGISKYADYLCYRNFGLESFIGAPVWVEGQLYGTISFSSQRIIRGFSEEEKEFVRILARWVGATLERSTKEQEIIRARKQAEKASLAKAQFLSTMSHEIRTPLNAVIGITHLLLQDDPKPEQVENLNALRFSGENLLSLINDILDFSKIEAGKIEIEAADFSLSQLLTGIRQSLGFKAKEKGLDFQVCEDKNAPPTLVGDPARLSQILNNLVSNAIKFTDQGIVSLTVSEVQRKADTIDLLFEVKDTGIGVPLEKQTSIFESFSQASADTNRRFGGTGLGLTITKKLLELQGSQIQLESQEGVGSRFFFVLRLKVGVAQLPVETSSFQQNSKDFGSLQGYKVLLVEDNSMNVIVARQFLNRWQLDFDHAENGEDAVRMVMNESYDLVLMDLQMPVMDGYQATRLIRQKYSSLPIIALTASAMLEIQEQVYKVGMNDFVTKPFNPSELYQKISKYLSRSRIKV